MPIYVIDDEFFCWQYLPTFHKSPEEAEVYYRRLLAQMLAWNSPSTLFYPGVEEARKGFRSKVASILRRGIKVREFNGKKPECGTTPADVR